MKFKLLSSVILACSLTGTLSKAQQVDFSFMNNTLPLEERVELLVSQMTLEEKISQMTNVSAAIPRLNVPSYDWWSEALHGVARNGKATIFPQAIAMGATFDPQLINKVATVISDEARAKYNIAQAMNNHSRYAGLTFWSPTVNIYRDPRYGRGQESYTEDPFLMSKIGVAFTRGLQGNDPNYIKVAACAKHFAMHSGPEHNKLSFDVKPTIQDLNETYFPAFKALVTEAKVEGVMAAYNMVYGKPSCISDFLLQETLRKNWKFDGYITTDCGAIYGAAGKQGYAKSTVEAAAMALKAGTNLNCGQEFKTLKEAVAKGLVTEQEIGDRLKQLLKTRFRLGMFDQDQSKNPYKNYGIEKIHTPESVALTREVAQKSIVLLKNRNNILPLSKNIKVPYVTGPFANSNDMLIASYYGVSSSLVTVMEGITDAVSNGTSLEYRSGVLPFCQNPNPKNYGPNVAEMADVTICVVGITADLEGEGVDAIASAEEGDRLSLKLPESQISYINQLIEKKGKKPFILVVASGSPVTLEGIEEHCDAILQIWYPGEQGGHAVADVLFGNVSPTGHLPITFPKSEKQLPPYETYNMKGRTYRYMTEEPAYPFGFGLTYSKSEFSNLKIGNTKLKKDNSLNITVDVANAGNYDIDEVVQLYVCPKDTTGGLPINSLKAFERVSLKKGEKKTIQLSVEPEQLKFVDVKGQNTWFKGDYSIVVGNAAPGDLSVRLGAAVPQKAMIQLK